jgi:hypothetical protein
MNGAVIVVGAVVVTMSLLATSVWVLGRLEAPARGIAGATTPGIPGCFHIGRYREHRNRLSLEATEHRCRDRDLPGKCVCPTCDMRHT